MMHSTFLTRPKAVEHRNALDLLMGYPARGVHRFNPDPLIEERHVDLDDAAQPGWTRSHSRIRKHPTQDRWAVRAGPKVGAALADEQAAVAIVGQAAYDAAKAKYDARSELTSDWFE